MKKYQYSLESILNHRQFIEDILQKEMAVLNRKREAEAQKMVQLEQNRNMAIDKLNEQEAKIINITEKMICMSYINRLNYEISRQKKMLNKVQKRCDKKREELITAMKNRKALEKHKQKGFDLFRKERNRNEMKFYNEVSLTKYMQKK